METFQSYTKSGEVLRALVHSVLISNKSVAIVKQMRFGNNDGTESSSFAKLLCATLR